MFEFTSMIKFKFVGGRFYKSMTGSESKKSSVRLSPEILNWFVIIEPCIFARNGLKTGCCKLKEHVLLNAGN